MKYIFMLCVLQIKSAIVSGCCSVSTREPEVVLSPLMQARTAKGKELLVRDRELKVCDAMKRSKVELYLEWADPWFVPEEWNNLPCTKEEMPRVRDNQAGSCNTDCDCVPCAPYCSK